MEERIEKMKEIIADFILNHEYLDDEDASEDDRIEAFWQAIGLDFFTDESFDKYRMQRKMAHAEKFFRKFTREKLQKEQRERIKQRVIRKMIKRRENKL